MSGTDRPPFEKLHSSETCEACGHRGWCMHSSTTIWCMRNPDGAYSTITDKAGLPVYLHHRTGTPAAEPYRAPQDERPDWANTTSPEGCTYLYTLLATEFARPTPTPPGVAADARRFGDHAEAVRAVEDAFYLADPEGLLRRIAEEGRTQDAKNAGILYADGHERAGQILTWLKCRKLFAWRDERGLVRDLRGRALDKSTPKVLSLAGSRADRGADGSWYQQGKLATCEGHIRVAGGHEKCDALNAAGLPCIGSNEGQASDAMIAALVERDIFLVTYHADGEDAKDGEALSQGQRLGIAIGDRFEAAGIAVRIAEPSRSPGEPGLDADSILRDHGPAALRDIDARAVPLSLYRRRLGITPNDDDPDRTRRLQEALRETREERDQAREWNRVTFATLRAGHGDTPKMKSVGRAALGLVLEWDTRRHQGKDAITDPKTGLQYFHVDMTAAGENVGLGDDAEGAALKYLCEQAGLAKKLTKNVPIENPEPGQYRFHKKTYIHFPFDTKQEIAAAIAAHRPETRPDQQPQGGRRTPCPECGGTKTKTVIVCAYCDTVLDAKAYPQDAGIELTTEGASLGETTTPAPVAEASPQLAVMLLPYCLNRQPGGHGCHHRVDQRGDRYCAGCAAEGFENLPASAYSYAAAGD